jgi:hypothetical protein
LHFQGDQLKYFFQQEQKGLGNLFFAGLVLVVEVPGEGAPH